MNDSVKGLMAAGMRLPLAGYTLDLGAEELRDGDGTPVELRPQAWQVLRHLALNAGRVVTKEELLGAVWPGLVVTDDSLVQAVGDVRRALGDAGHRLLKTVPRRGYTLVADALMPPAEAASHSAGPAALPVEPLPVAAVTAPGGPAAPARRGLALALLAAALVVAAIAWTITRPASVAAPPAAMADQRMPDRPSVAILAFKAPDGGPADQQVARGVAEDLIAELARNRDLRVVAYQSSFSFAGKDLPPARIGEQLGSRYLVDGSVRRDGELLRIGIEMIDSRDGHVVWASQHAADSLNVIATRDALVRRIAGTVHSQMRQSEERTALARPPKTLDVYAMTLRAAALKHQFQPDATREARALLQQAIAIDPDYAPAQLYLGMLNALDSMLRQTGEWHPGRLPEMLVPIRRAIQLDPELPAAYFAEAIALADSRDFRGALAATQRCVELGPNDADCWQFLGRVQLSLGQVDAGLVSSAHALDLNPLPPAYIKSNRASALWAARRHDESLRMANDCLLKAPRYVICRRHRIAALVETGRLDEARQDAATLLEQVPTMTTRAFKDHFDDSAVELQQRYVAAALAAGIPPEPAAK